MNNYKIDKNTLQVAAIMIAVVAALLVINSYAMLGAAERSPFISTFSREAAVMMATIAAMPVLYFLALWSRVIHFIRKPINMTITVLITLLFVYSIVMFWSQANQAFWGRFDLPSASVTALLIVGVCYLNSFLYSLSSEYDRKYQRANEEKLRAERFKSELITNVSHDLQTPLTSIINYSDLLKKLSPQDAEFDQKFAEYTEVLDRKSARLKTLTADLLEASKASTGNVAVVVRPVKLAEAVWQVAGEFDDRFAEKDLSFVFDPDDEGLTVSADPQQLWRVLENLYANASKYALPGTRIFAAIDQVAADATVDKMADATAAGSNLEATETAAQVVKLTLKNISAQHLDQTGGDLTEQFIRGDAARQSEGSGLGLHIAKSLTELMGGELAVAVSGDLFEVSILLQAA
ncbi:MAG: HAMP domain-containing histidine kinase [Coriobacteriia bacterium]|nr:HAMP domain-containing histidine kinase [Coriobacteriia bacterium]MCL2536679.1 HAMP domain-containing histidine kinase [Coriobacteriia bacterium]